MDNGIIIAARVPEDQQACVVADHFGAFLALRIEDEIYAALRRIAADYSGACWRFYQLSNGGFYMAPDLESLQIRVAVADFDEKLSADGAGVLASLLAFSGVFPMRVSQMMASQYRLLRSFAVQHAEAEKILTVLQATDVRRRVPGEMTEREASSLRRAAATCA